MSGWGRGKATVRNTQLWRGQESLNIIDDLPRPESTEPIETKGVRWHDASGCCAHQVGQVCCCRSSSCAKRGSDCVRTPSRGQLLWRADDTVGQTHERMRALSHRFSLTERLRWACTHASFPYSFLLVSISFLFWRALFRLDAAFEMKCKKSSLMNTKNGKKKNIVNDLRAIN